MAPPPGYIQPTEVDAYGVANVPAATLARASAMIDTVLRRRDGMIWAPDSDGWPCYMLRKTPAFSLTVTGSVAPGEMVIVTLPTGAHMGDNWIGEAAVLDRAVPAATEACIIRAFDSYAGTVTLDLVRNAHTGPFVIDFGLSIMEERSLPAQRSITRLLETPVARVLSGVGRYGYGRRSEQALGTYADVNLLTMVSTFAGPPVWAYFSTDASSMNTMTGDIWVPPGVLLAYYTEVKFRYIAGWSIAGIPEPIKQATAMVGTAIQSGQFPGNALKLKAGDHEIQRGVATVLDTDMMRMLAPYRAHMFV